ELAHLNMLLPHIAKAIDLGRPARQLSFEHQSLLAAMDRLTIGVCILDSNGCEVLANDEFKRQQSVYKTLLSAPNGVLHFTRSEDQAIFESLKQDASKHGQFGARPRKEAIAIDTESYLCIEVLPLARSEEMGSKPLNGFAVFSTDTGLPFSCNIPAIQAAYGLTDAEFALVDAIAEGLTNTQIAERRGRSVATINSQVKSILFKTQCSTRTQFVRLMMTFNGHYLA
ncbi:MAG: helix-turn-helix transcriptional regulator, partial [Cohaesibacter sp.]|nr:helix-turn-helix transcriptional regulator [Cohaesibacter sp.]